MEKVVIDLENCYGIKKLHKELDFSSKNVYAIYAPNGMMKSSLAQTFQDIAAGNPSIDRIFQSRSSRRSIIDEDNNVLQKECVFVVRPYDEEFAHTEKTSTLLVDAKLRKEYEQLNAEIDKSKNALLKGLKIQSGSRRDFVKEISLAFTKVDDDFYGALKRIREELIYQKDTPFEKVVYDQIFDERVLEFLGRKEVKAAIQEYVRRYNELLAASTYFKKGTFDYYNAAQIAKSLADNGFFEAKHTVNLNADKRLEISTQKELEAVIAKEKEEIITDAELRRKFDAIEKQITKNEVLRDFKEYITENEALISQLSNIEKFREDVLKSYLKAQGDLYTDLMRKYSESEERKMMIEGEAAKQQTQWEEVIDIFNGRFIVPFKLNVKNKIDVMLRNEPMISLGFTYYDGEDNVPLEKGALLTALSTGEKKAFYILNIIFEIEARKKASQETIIVIDDIADSFDYQNKYAIIQYLKEISEEPIFKQIIMTHNFDFFRTVNSRFIDYAHCLMASKGSFGIALEPACGIKNVFVNDWKQNYYRDQKKKIASIPFIRNLIEYTKGETDSRFIKLTSLLHWKADSASITESELDAIYNEMFEGSAPVTNGTGKVVDIIQREARSCMTNSPGINLENKIVLAIAIRIAAEKFMVEKINNSSFVESIISNQTQSLLRKYKEDFPRDINAIRILERVVLMTPENIHLNSFMYEPIIDMADECLKKLYKEVLDLN
jgi:hypothetical protein